MKKKGFCLLIAWALALCMLMSSASACTTIYAGKDATADGAVIFGRSEDYSNSQNKLFFVAPAGQHKAGDLYEGCYGFTYTFTHDSYGYTAFSDDNGDGVGGVCPDCGGDHAHTPYQAAGTNDRGLSVTATESISGSPALEAADPFEDLGIEEAEIVTVLLSEAATAKEALALLTALYDTAGANAGSGLIVADANEAWYIENVTGHQYIAVRLADGLVMVQPNMPIIGAIDLDDTDHVIASAGLIDVAVQAGAFVGDEGANVINYVLSYGGGTAPNQRMLDALAFLDPAFADGVDDPAVYLITNVGADGAIVPMHTGIRPAAKLTIAEVQDFYRIPSIGYVRNLETHIFQIAGEGPLGTVEWVAMDDTALSVFIPYYPMLTTGVDASYQLSTALADFAEEAPQSGLSYRAAVYMWGDGQYVPVSGYIVLPENWAGSMYWSFDALSNLVMYAGLDEAAVQAAYGAVCAAQAKINADFAAFQAALNGADAAAATAFSLRAAREAHALALTLVSDLLSAAK